MIARTQLPHATGLEQHPIGRLQKMKSESEFAKLCKSIGEYGLREAVTLYEDMVLDGWCRYLACKKLKKDILIKQANKTDLARFVLYELDVQNRNFTKIQRAMLGAYVKFAHEDEAAVRKKSGKKVSDSEKGSSAAMAGKKLGVSAAYVTRATEILKKDPKLARMLLAEKGTMTLPQAHELLQRRTRKGQPKIPGRPRRASAKNQAKARTKDNSAWNLRLFNMRMALGETQSHFAKRFRRSVSCVSLWEHGKRDVRGPAQVVLTDLERTYADELSTWTRRLYSK